MSNFWTLQCMLENQCQHNMYMFIIFFFLLQFLFVGTNIGLFVGYFFFYKDDPGFRYLNDITGVSLAVHTIS